MSWSYETNQWNGLTKDLHTGESETPDQALLGIATCVNLPVWMGQVSPGVKIVRANRGPDDRSDVEMGVIIHYKAYYRELF